ncbi:DNA (cytosine-5)-methyltransferase 3C-like [Rhopalosiphum maidis]|uniref:DNA (cytosine-5)-methyltransferase 3C-like n=1 Tax=Rhopalosiphum maidis TaxID=43146 RepID=UPI000F003D10|nr:DNA (cytosine-5)-methyltransferase 3C-like [Rhopalosiphum maidis]
MADKQSTKRRTNNVRKKVKPSSNKSTSKLPRLRVLSLFDGIGTGYYSLKKLGFDIEAFYACEIDKDALMLTKYHFADNIIQLGSVTEITNEVLDKIGPINLLFGGSPCADLSSVNFRKKGIYDPDGTGILFFDYYRIWNYLQVKCRRNNTPFYWLFENVASMELKNKEYISKFFECQPNIVDSLHFSPQRRRRFFWANLPDMEQLFHAREIGQIGIDEPKLEDYLEKNLDRRANVEKVGTITSKRSCLQDGKSRNPVSQDGQYTGLYITEIEAIFGLPHHFTDVGDLSIASRQKLIGRAWSVQVIKKLLSLLENTFAKL